jgi:glutamyl-tRNA reductase
VPPGHLTDVLARLHAVPTIDEVIVLSTCNRLEVYAVAQGPIEPVTRAITDLLAARGGIPAGEVVGMARIRVGGAAAEQLFSVACGLDSMAVGEDQIVAQIKAAARAAAGSAPPASRSPVPASTSLRRTSVDSPAAMQSSSGPAA